MLFLSIGKTLTWWKHSSMSMKSRDHYTLKRLGAQQLAKRGSCQFMLYKMIKPLKYLDPLFLKRVHLTLFSCIPIGSPSCIHRFHLLSSQTYDISSICSYFQPFQNSPIHQLTIKHTKPNVPLPHSDSRRIPTPWIRYMMFYPVSTWHGTLLKTW